MGRGAAAIVLLLAAAVAAPAAGSPARSVVLMVFDGLAPAMVESVPTPALDRMAREGAMTHALEPAFPTISLINGFTLSTGCWPERHGIVTNKFLDPERGVYDHDRDADWLLDCEGLHESAERQGVRAATLGWYGQRSRTRGDLASDVAPDRTYAEAPPDAERADAIASLLRRSGAERPRLVLAYLRGPDMAAHRHGLGAEETRQRVRESDAVVGRVLTMVDALPPAQRDATAVLVTTDHGMVPAHRLVNIQRILRRLEIEGRALATGSTAYLYLDDPSRVDAAAARLAAIPELEVIRPEDPPAWYHGGAGPRAGDLIVSVRPPHFIEDPELWPSWLRWLARIGPDFLPAGPFLGATHGYPPGTPGVDGVLYAWGSGIASGRRAGRIRVVDVHPTVAHLLGIRPGEPVDGEVARALLAPP